MTKSTEAAPAASAEAGQERVEARKGDKLGAITVGLHDDPGIALLRRIVDSICIMNNGEQDLACWDHFAMFELRDYLCALATAQPAAQGWQPIETAPKDGRTLLLGYFNRAGKWRTVRGQWMSDEYIAEYWEDPDMAEAGWFETCEEADETPNCWPINPTHFMPLPAAPQSPDTKGGV
jgi:hypothetical protein